jgi:hypothetical protein
MNVLCIYIGLADPDCVVSFFLLSLRVFPIDVVNIRTSILLFESYLPVVSCIGSGKARESEPSIQVHRVCSLSEILHELEMPTLLVDTFQLSRGK